VAILSHPQSVGVQKAACVALGAMTTGNAANLTRARNAGAVDAEVAVEEAVSAPRAGNAGAVEAALAAEEAVSAPPPPTPAASGMQRIAIEAGAYTGPLFSST